MIRLCSRRVSELRAWRCEIGEARSEKCSCSTRREARCSCPTSTQDGGSIMFHVVSECLLTVTLLGQGPSLPVESAEVIRTPVGVSLNVNADRSIRVHRLRDRLAKRVLNVCNEEKHVCLKGEHVAFCNSSRHAERCTILHKRSVSQQSTPCRTVCDPAQA